MKTRDFLNKLKRENKVEIVEPSEEIKSSYLKKAEDCLKSAKILLNNKLYENSVINCYFTMYNSILSILFKLGIKSENHSGSITIFEHLFKEDKLAKTIREAKAERIDKQYYIEDRQDKPLTESLNKQSIIIAEDFLIKMKIIISRISNEEISNKRKEFELLLNNTLKEKNRR